MLNQVVYILQLVLRVCELHDSFVGVQLVLVLRVDCLLQVDVLEVFSI